MAFVAIKVPEHIGKVLEREPVPGTPEKASDYHISMVYLGKGLSMEGVAGAVLAAYPVIQKVDPFPLGIRKVTSFPNGDDGVPIVAVVSSPTLHLLRDHLLEAFTKAGVPFEDKFPEFKPHVCLSYAPDPIPDRNLLPMAWPATEVTIWGADHGDGRVAVTLPFDRYESRKAAIRGVVRLCVNWP